MPWTHKLIPNLSGWAKLRDVADVMWKYLHPISRKMLLEYKGDSPQYFAHVYIDEIRRTVDKSSSFHGERGGEIF